jgi:hypothetical protein
MLDSNVTLTNVAGSHNRPYKEPTMTKLTVMICSAFLFLIVTAGAASANHESGCVVTDSSYNTFPGTNGALGKFLSVNCASGTFYESVVNTANSGVASACQMDIDTLKMWQSLSVAAHLSGRTVTVWYNPSVNCGGFPGTTNVITAIEFK